MYKISEDKIAIGTCIDDFTAEELDEFMNFASFSKDDLDDLFKNDKSL